MGHRLSEFRLAVAVVVSLIVTGGTSFCAKADAQTSPVTLAPVITTIAGNGTANFLGDGGPATAASLNGPAATAVDSAGNVYMANAYSSRIRKVDTNGLISTIVGNGSCNFGGDEGPATSATICQPYGVAVDNSGNVFIADTYNHRIRKVNSSGIISTIVGNGTPSFSGDGGQSVNATVNSPTGVAVDATGNIFIADSGNYRIRMIRPNGIISTVAGNGNAGFSGDGRPAINASFNTTRSVAVDTAGNIYIADIYNTRIRKVDTSGIISTITGGSYGFSGDGGPAVDAQISNSYGVNVDAIGNVYFVDTYNNRVRKIDTTGIISTIAGNGTGGFAGDGGAPSSAQLNGPYGVTVDAMGNVYIADTNNQRIRKVQESTLNFGTIPVGHTSATQNLYLEVQNGVSVSSITVPQSEGGAQEYVIGTVSGCPLLVTLSANTVCTVPITFAPAYPGLRGVPLVVTASVGTFSFSLIGIGLSAQTVISPGIIDTVAGNGNSVFGGDGGPASSAGMLTPSGVARDKAGNMYIATYDARIRKVDRSGTITTVAGNGTTCPDPTTPCGDGGKATDAQFVQPYNVAVDEAGNFYISDINGLRVRKVDLNGTITTVAGNGTACADYTSPCGDGGLGTNANLGYPYGIAFDSSGNLYITEETGNRIRKLSPSGTISTIAGTGAAGFSGDGGPATSATMFHPLGIAVDAANNVYIADAGNQRIRKVEAATGLITTIAGGGSTGIIAANGAPATSVILSLPVAVAVDAGGSFYVVDFGLHAIDKVDSATGTIRRIAGVPGTPGNSGDGGSATSAELNGPQAIALDSSGAQYIADSSNNRVRRVTVTAAPLVFPDTAVGQMSASQSSLLSNIGNSGLVVTGVTTTPDFHVEFLGVCPRSVTLDPGTSCDLATSFQPQQAGSRTGTVTIIDDSRGLLNSAELIQLSGNGLLAATTTELAISTANTVPFGTPVTLTATVIPNAAAAVTATGTMSFYDGATLLARLPISPTGTASTTTSTLTAGTPHSLSSVYAGDANFSTSSSNVVPLTVSPVTVVLTTSKNPSTYGQTVTFTGTVPSGATGSIQFQSDGVNLGSSVAIVGTSATLTTTETGLTHGSHLITAIYSGNSVFSESRSGELVQLVNPAVLTATANSSTRTFNLPNPDLTYTITGFVGSDNEANSVTGVAIVTTDATIDSPVGTYPIQIRQGSLGSLNYEFRFVPGALTVTKATPGAGGVPPVTIASSANPSVWGQPVTLTATLPAPATGLVTFKDGTTVIGTATITNSNASISTQLLAIATHSITAVYAGDTNYNGASSTSLSQVVDKALLVVVPNNIQRIYGQPNPVLTSSFSGFVNGDTSAVLTGEPNLTTTGTITSEAGSYPITATQGTLASPNYVFSFVAGTLLISPATPGVGPTPPVTISSSSNPAIFGNPVTLSAAVPAGATGTVSFLDGKVSLAVGAIIAGAASITTSTLFVGTHPITAVYSGDTNYYGASSAVLSEVVNKVSTAVTLISSLNPSTFGNAVTLTATISAGATGTVTFHDGTTALGTGIINNGVATLTTSSLAVGSHSITVQYGGDTNYNGAVSIAVSQVVSLATPTVSLESSLNPSTYGTSVTFTAAVPAGAAGTVTFEDNGTAISGAVPISGSTTTFTTSTLAVGSHPIIAVYSGDTNYNGANSSVLMEVVNQTTLSVNPTTVMYGNPAALTAVVGPTAGATGTVSFHEGSTLLGTSSLDSSATAVLSVSTLIVGSHTITATYNGDTNFPPSTSNPATLTVTQRTGGGEGGASLTVTANDASRTTTEANPPFSHTVAGELVNGDTYATAVTGTPTYSTTAGTAAGTFAITVSGLTSQNYVLAFVPATLTVVPSSSTTTLATSPNSSLYGDPVTLTATVTPGATGTASFYDGPIYLGQGTVTGSAAALTTTTLNAGTHTITAIYNGDATYASSTSGPATVTVAKKTAAGGGPALTVTVLNESREYGTANPEFSYMVSGALLNGDTYETAVTGVPIYNVADSPNSPVGSNFPINVSGLMSQNYTLTTVPGTLTIVTAATTTALTIATTTTAQTTSVTSQYGDPVTLTATVAPTSATGTVVFSKGSTVVGTAAVSGGTATLIASSQSVGTKTITASYQGDANHAASTSSPVTTIVTPRTGPDDGAALTVTVTNASRQYGQGNPAFSYTVTGTLVNGDTYATAVTGVPVYSTTATVTSPVGNYPISIAGGLSSANYSLAFMNGTLTVSKGTPSVTLVSSQNPSTPAASVTFTATLSAGATGTVTFLDGATVMGIGPVSGGTANFPTSTLSIGTHSITAAYSGDGNYNGVTSPALSQVVNKTATTVAVASSRNPAPSGSSVTFTATVPAGARGTVQFLDGTTVLGTGTVSGGTASFSTTTLSAGTHSITAVYSGDASYNGATSSAVSQVVQTIGGPQPTFTVASTTGPQLIPPGASASYSITVTPVNGAFNNVVTLTATNLPPGSSYTFAPTALTPGFAGATSTFIVSVPKQSAALRRVSKTPFALAVLLLPIALLRRTRARPPRLLLWLLLSLTSFGAISGCGSGGYFNQPQQTYTITITATSGNLSNSSTVTLTVQ